MIDYTDLIDKYYEPGSHLREILLVHSSLVTEKALNIASEKHLDLDTGDITAAGMLHDIGICFTQAPAIECFGTEPYICHGLIGSELIREVGLPESIARVAERHTGSGITALEITEQGLPIPPADYLPETLLEKLICYADKFYSKGRNLTKEKSPEQARRSLERFGAATLSRFDALHAMFGQR